MTSARRICVTPLAAGVGGMVSFRRKLAEGLARRGYTVVHDLDDLPYAAVLVIGGTRRLGGLRRAAQRGARVVQRLDGMNWLHRLRLPTRKRNAGLRQWLRAEYGNLLLAFIRARLAAGVVYQSRFAQAWWERVYGPTRPPHRVIYNGVDLAQYQPAGEEAPPADRLRLLLVEGSFMGGYDLGLEVAVQLAEALQDRLRPPLPGAVELTVAGQAPEGLRRRWDARARVRLNWAGLVESGRIPALDRSAHLLYSADINAACPNSAIEALACGLPVLAFDTGALPELIQGDAGRVVAYGGDPWQLDPPDVAALAEAALEIVSQPERFRLGARRRAEQAFGLDCMVESYLEALLG